jgi:anti-sigma B factor antagonist
MILKIEDKRIEPDMSGKLIGGNESQRLEWKLNELIEGNARKLILDLSGVKYVDSGGVGIIAVAGGKMKEAGGAMLLAGAQGTVGEVLKFTRVGEFLGMFPTAAAAAESLASA